MCSLILFVVYGIVKNVLAGLTSSASYQFSGESFAFCLWVQFEVIAVGEQNLF